jgi:hypothetical protein
MQNLVKILTVIALIATAINPTSAKVLFTEKIGSPSGSNFMLPAERFDVLSTESIKRIAVQHGRRIEQIQSEYSNGQNVSQVESVGNDAGEWSVIELEEGEYIIYITGRAGTLIDQLTFHTSRRRTFGPYGGTGGQDFEISIPSNGKVIGFTGNVGPSINQIGLIYKTPDGASDNAENNKRIVRDHRTKNSDSTSADNNQAPEASEFSDDYTQELTIKTAPASTARIIRDHRNLNSNPNYHPDSLRVVNYGLFERKEPKKSGIEINGRIQQVNNANRNLKSTVRKSRDHRKGK